MYVFGLDFEVIDMIKEWLVKGAKEAEGHMLGIMPPVAASRRRKRLLDLQVQCCPKQAQIYTESGSGRTVSSEYTVDAFYVVSNNHFIQFIFSGGFWLSGTAYSKPGRGIHVHFSF